MDPNFSLTVYGTLCVFFGITWSGGLTGGFSTWRVIALLCLMTGITAFGSDVIGSLP